VRDEVLPGKPLIRVAAGVLRRPDGGVLFTQRPEGKIAAGYWEFPGGKIEAGETPLQALTRELHEELGVTVRAARPLIRFRHEYSNRSVVLDTWLVDAFDGEVQSRESQAFRWVTPSQLAGWPQALPTVAPIAQALNLPTHYVFTPPDADDAFVETRLSRLPAGSLLRLRFPALDDARYHARARALAPAIRAAGLHLVLDRDPQQAAELGAAGWHATAATVQTLSTLPAHAPRLRLVSTHTAAELDRAAALGFDAAVLGPVQNTPTHPGQSPLGWEGFEAQARHLPLPVYALGGLGPRDTAAAFKAYAQGVCGISAYWNS
jgi:8-oxo-dGTP diphosphatase